MPSTCRLRGVPTGTGRTLRFRRCGTARMSSFRHAGRWCGGLRDHTRLTTGKKAGGEQFQAHARRNRTGHVGQRGVDRIRHLRKRGQSQRSRLAMQIVHVLGRGVVRQHAFRTLTAQGEHQQVAHACQQVLNETSGVESADHDLLNDAIQRLAVLVGDGVDCLADKRVRRETKQRDRGIVRNLAVDGTDHQLVEHGQRVTYGSAAGTHGQAQHTRFGLDMLVGADLLKIRAHDLLWHQTERIVVGAGANGADHLVRFGGGEDEHDMLRRLLHDFQERVEALRRDHVGLVEDEDFIAIAGRGESGTFTQFTGIVHTVMGGGVDFHHVDGAGAAGGKVTAAGAFAARMRGRTFGAVDATGQNTRGTRFTAAARSGEQIGVRELVLVKRTHQRNRDLILSDHAIEHVGTIPSIQCQCHRKFLPP